MIIAKTPPQRLEACMRCRRLFSAASGRHAMQNGHLQAASGRHAMQNGDLQAASGRHAMQNGDLQAASG
jgi:hypothetical protein